MTAERGQSMLEFALVVPFFIVILFALFEFGRGMVEYTSLSNAAREGARSGIVATRSLTDITGAARAVTVTVGTAPAVQILAFRGGVQIEDAATRQSGDTVQVRVSHSFVPVFGVAQGYQPAGIGGLGLSIPMSSTARMRVE